MERIVSLAAVLFIVTIAVIAQEPAKSDAPPDYRGAVGGGKGEVPKQISGGVLNGKAVSLPKPPFPAAAKAVGASGAVSVQVLIDENGTVVSATAISGHPLLRGAATEAARGAKFSPTKLMGNPVKDSGIITYNFIGPLLPADVGCALAYAERKGMFDRSANPDLLAGQLPPDWLEEREVLKLLTYETPKKTSAPDASNENATPARDKKEPRDPNRFTVMGDINYSGNSTGAKRKMDQRSIESLRTLRERIAARWAQDENAAWANRLGSTLGVLAAESDDPSKLVSHLAELESVLSQAPSTVNPALIESVREFLNDVRAADLDLETKHKLAARAEMLAKRRY